MCSTRSGSRQTAPALDVGRRTLSTGFRRHFGLGLKQYDRIGRFERAVARVRNPTGESLAAIAATTGYSDQAHMTRDFRDLSGRTPATLRRTPGSSVGHVVDDEMFKTASDTNATTAS